MIRCMWCMSEYEDHSDICPYCSHERNSFSDSQGELPAETILQGRYIVGAAKIRRLGDISYIGWDALFNRRVWIQEYFPKLHAVRRENQDLTAEEGYEEKYADGVSQYLFWGKQLIRLYKEPDILSIYSVFREHNTGYLTMEYTEDTLLYDWVEEGMEPEEAMKQLKEAIAAVKKVHRLGIFHGQLETDSFFITSSGHLVLTGFNGMKKCEKTATEQTDVRGLAGLFCQMVLGDEYRELDSKAGWAELGRLCTSGTCDLIASVLRQRTAKPIHTMEELEESLLELETRKEKAHLFRGFRILRCLLLLILTGALTGAAIAGAGWLPEDRKSAATPPAAETQLAVTIGSQVSTVPLQQ